LFGMVEIHDRRDLAVGGHVNSGVALEGVFAPPENSSGLRMDGSPRQFLWRGFSKGHCTLFWV